MSAHILNPYNRLNFELLSPSPIADTDNEFILFNSANGVRKISFAELVNSIRGSIINGVRTTGEVVHYASTAAPSGWVLAAGKTIGSASSGATERANSDTLALYTLLWTSFSNTELPIQNSTGTPTTRGSNAADDYANAKRLPVPDLRGRVIAGLDNLGGISANRLNSFSANIIGSTGGFESNTITAAELPDHDHSYDSTSTTSGAVQSGSGETAVLSSAETADSTGSTGDGDPLNILQPTIVLGAIIKL
jgi:microcystin-dependent protein